MEALSAMALPPGFGFHPTDVELISHYLKRKVLGLKTDLEVIPEVDIYKHEPWDLPARCQVPTRDCKWHFFSSRDRKYPKGSRSNRATEEGYWKSTGKDRNIRFQNRVIGTKKTLVFHKGRPPCGRRTDWIMHEYYINESECKAAPDMKDSFVLCRITKRDGLVVDGANVRDNVLQPENIDGFSNQTQDVDSLVTAMKSPSPPESVEDMDAWISELFDPSADSILTEIKSEPTEGISSVAINQEPLNPNFLPETADDLFQVDEFYNILQSDHQQTFGDQQGGTFGYPFNDPQEQDDIFAYLNNNNNEFITPVEDTTIITDTGITLRQRGATPSSSSVQRQRIKLQVSKMESRNAGPSLCRTVEVVEQDFHLDHHDEKPKSVSDDALRVGKTKMSSSLVAQNFRAEKRNAAKSRFNCFFVGACIVGAGALVYYFSALRL